MKKFIVNTILFTAGAAIGSAVTWKVVKTKYERIAQEEINDVREYWANKMRNNDNVNADNDVYCDEDDVFENEPEEEEYDPDMDEYCDLARMYDQSGDDAENDGEGAGDDEVPYINGPYMILPEDFGDGNYDHSVYGLTYYTDGVLANDWLETFDIEETIGEDALEHFGDHVEDVVHVRNERLSADYEVVRDPRSYAEMVANEALKRGYATD